MMLPSFWGMLWENRRNVFLQWDLLVAIAVAVLAAFLVSDSTLQERYTVLLGTTGGATIGLLGLTLAGLALFVAQVNDSFIKLAQAFGRGIIEDYFPFYLAAWVAVLTALVSIVMLAVTPRDEIIWMRIGTGLSIGLFTWTLFHIIALVNNLAQHGLTRADLAVRGTPRGKRARIRRRRAVGRRFPAILKDTDDSIASSLDKRTD